MATSTVTGNVAYSVSSTAYDSTDLTIEGWFNCRTAGTSYFLNYETGSAALGLTIRTTANGAGYDLHVSQSVGGGSTFANCVTSGGSTPLNTNRWYHIAVVLPTGWTTTPSLAKIYVNGSAATVDTSGSTGTGSANDLNGTLTLFNRTAGSRQMDGMIQRLRTWRRAMSASEVTECYGAYTDAQTAAISCVSSLKNEMKGETDTMLVEYSTYPASTPVEGTVTGTVSTPDLSRYPRTIKMAALWRASDGAYSDTGLTTLISANVACNGAGAGVAGIKDLTLCGNNATQSTNANKGDWYTNGAGIQAISADVASYNAKFALATASKWDARNTTIWMVGRWSKITEEGHTLFGTSASDLMVQCESDGRLSGSNNSANIHGSDSLCVYVWVFGSSGITIYRNGVSATASAASAATGLTGGYLFANGSGTETFDGWMCEAGIYQDTQLTAAEASAHINTLMSLYGIPNYIRKCVLDGTSSMLGSSSTYRRNRSWLLNQKSGTRDVMFFNCAFGGETLANMTSDIAVLGNLRTRELALEPSKKIKMWAQGGANEAADGAAASTALDTYLAAAIAQGYRRSDIAVQCILPSSAANLSGDQTQSAIYNNAVRAKGCFLFDSTSDSGWQWANYTSAGYYASGNIHLNDSGFSREVDGYLANPLRRFLFGSSHVRGRCVGARGRP